MRLKERTPFTPVEGTVEDSMGKQFGDQPRPARPSPQADCRISILPERVAEIDVLAGNPDLTLTRAGWGPSGEPEADYRTALAGWPDERRERWGRRANEQAERGVPHPLNERRAFGELAAFLSRDDPYAIAEREAIRGELPLGEQP